MFRSLYAKLLVLFLAILLIAMSLFTGMIYQQIRTDRIQSRLSELAVQAEDIVNLAQLFARTGNYMQQTTLRDYYISKVNYVQQEFDASIYVYDQNQMLISIEDEEVLYTHEDVVEEMDTVVGIVFSGKNVVQSSILQSSGNPVFVVGVPLLEKGTWLVNAAVIVVTSEQNIQASYSEVLAQSLSALLISFAIGSAMILILCQYITRPLRAMASAADRFARGDFEQRVKVESRDEVGRLAESFNSMAEDLNQLEQTRREFVANVSHELRSPLTSIQGFLNGMLDGTVPEPEREHYMGIVLDETKRLSKLISTLLDLSHIESGQTPLQKTRFDINEMICRVLVRQEAHIGEREIDVQLAFETEACLVSADADRIEQVLVNLIDNAIKYANGHGCITVSTRKERGKVRITVADDGPGIAKEDLPRVFDRFYMAEKAHTSGKGTGLGLSIVKKILEQHGEKITVKSELGKGARFEFTLEGA